MAAWAVSVALMAAALAAALAAVVAAVVAAVSALACPSNPNPSVAAACPQPLSKMGALMLLLM